VSRAIVDLHGGRLRVEERRERESGACVIVSPAIEKRNRCRGDLEETGGSLVGSPPRAGPALCRRLQPSGRLLHILRWKITRTPAERPCRNLLRLMGHEVTVATTVATALDHGRRHPERRRPPVDSVVSDLGLPDGPGRA